jgi:hypothetical protein
MCEDDSFERLQSKILCYYHRMHMTKKRWLFIGPLIGLILIGSLWGYPALRRIAGSFGWPIYARPASFDLIAEFPFTTRLPACPVQGTRSLYGTASSEAYDGVASYASYMMQDSDWVGKTVPTGISDYNFTTQGDRGAISVIFQYPGDFASYNPAYQAARSQYTIFMTVEVLQCV